MGVNSLPKTVTRQRRDYHLNPGPDVERTDKLRAASVALPRTEHCGSAARLYTALLSSLV